MSAPKGLLQRGLAFVDIETTGGSSQRESITEIGIVELDESGVREWSSLVRPEMPIPAHIERLTGISNRMIADAPRFADLADTVFDRLEGGCSLPTMRASTMLICAPRFDAPAWTSDRGCCAP